MRSNKWRSRQDRTRSHPAILPYGRIGVLGTESALQAGDQAGGYASAAPEKAMRHMAQQGRARQVDRTISHRGYA